MLLLTGSIKWRPACSSRLHVPLIWFRWGLDERWDATPCCHAAHVSCTTWPSLCRLDQSRLPSLSLLFLFLFMFGSCAPSQLQLFSEGAVDQLKRIATHTHMHAVPVPVYTSGLTTDWLRLALSIVDIVYKLERSSRKAVSKMTCSLALLSGLDWMDLQQTRCIVLFQVLWQLCAELIKWFCQELLGVCVPRTWLNTQEQTIRQHHSPCSLPRLVRLGSFHLLSLWFSCGRRGDILR